MAASAISIEQYLYGPGFGPGVEYIDGELREKPVTQSVHGRLQAIISAWFEAHSAEWGVVAAVEVNTRVAQKRVRLPDIVVDADKLWPMTLVDPPLIVMEIISPSEGFTELLEKLSDYERMGVRNIWVIDPTLRKAWASVAEGLLATERFTVHDTPIYLDLNETFARYDRPR